MVSFVPITAAPPSGFIARPDYQVNVLRRSNRIEVHDGAHRLASSDRAIVIDEQDHALVVYFPREDVDIAALVPLPALSTHCPFKGDANYWTSAAALGEPIAWSYRTPYPQVAAIADHIAFDQDRVIVRLMARAGR